MTALKNLKLMRILAVSVILFTCGAANTSSMVGRKVPRVTVDKWVTPNPPTIANLKGRVYVIEFWATWCPPCVRTIPRMIELADKYMDKGVLFIGLSKDKSAKEVRRFIRRSKINYHIGLDNGVGKKFLFKGIPKVFVISHTGEVLWEGGPMNRGFESAIINALQAGPPPFLIGLELGPFESLRLQLSGGRGFVKAYRKLKTEAQESDFRDSEVASEIIKEIDTRIKARIKQAEGLRRTDPIVAFELYQQIVKNYRGIEATRTAVAAHDELKNNLLVRNEIIAARSTGKVERLLKRCNGCVSCGDFSLACKECAKLNEITLDRVGKILTAICKNYEGTKAAKIAQRQLGELNGEVLEVK